MGTTYPTYWEGPREMFFVSTRTSHHHNKIYHTAKERNQQWWKSQIFTAKTSIEPSSFHQTSGESMKSTLAIWIYMAAVAATSAIQKGSDSVAKERLKTLVERKMAKHKHHGMHAESTHANHTAKTAEVDVVRKKHHKNHTTAETEEVELVQKKHHKDHNETKAEVSETTGKKHHKKRTEQPNADEIGLIEEPELIEKNLAKESGLIEQPKHEKHHKNHTKPIGEDAGLVVTKEMGRNGHGPKDSIAAMIEEETMDVSPYVEAVVPTIEATTAELEDPTAAVVNQQNSYVSSGTKSRIWIFYIVGILSTIC